MSRRVRFSLVVICVVAVVFSVYASITYALQASIRNQSSSYVVEFEYANKNSLDAAGFVAGVIENSLGQSVVQSGTALQVTTIEHTFPMKYSPVRGLTSIEGADGTKATQLKVSDTVFTNAQNQLSFVLTPNRENRCPVLADVKGCVWDSQKLNQWNPDLLACLGGKQFECSGTSFNTAGVNIMPAETGGKVRLTIVVKGGIEREQLLYFPVKTFQYSPQETSPKSENLTSGVTVLLTERAVFSPVSSSTPASSSVSSSSSSLSSSSSSVVSSSASVVSSSVSSSVNSSTSSVPTTRTLAASDIARLDIFCREAVVSTSTTCTFTLPSGVTLGTTTRIALGSLASSPCTVVGVDVTCAQVPVPAAAGASRIVIELSGVRSESGKSANIVANSGSLVRTGALEDPVFWSLILFFVVSLTALVYSLKNRTLKKIEL